ncbi:MAG: acyl carrier protein [Chloroflexota bacterium]
MSTLHAMSEEQILATLISILQDVAPEADFDEIEQDEDIRETLDIDSFDFLNVLIALNDETGVEIPEADYGKLVSLDDIVKYVAAKMP